MGQPAARAGESLEIRQIGCTLGGNRILDRIDLALAPGEVVALLGPSGCGKTTLLKLVAGMLAPDAGTIRIGARTVAAVRRCLPPEARQLGMVFQDYALWPHLSVADNVGFPLAVRGQGRMARRERVERALERVGLAGFGHRSPADLSGGQQQRVALARAIVVEPGLLLFDEPLSNLDRELRETLCIEIGALLRDIGSTALYVTHDHEEAMSLADRVAVMAAGRILQIDAPLRLVEAPQSLAVARFLKLGNLLPGAVGADGSLWLDGLVLPGSVDAPWAGQVGAGQLLVPFTALSVADRAPAFEATVVARRYRGGLFDTDIRPARATTGWRWLTADPLPVDSALSLTIDRRRLHWFSDRPAPNRPRATDIAAGRHLPN